MLVGNIEVLTQLCFVRNQTYQFVRNRMRITVKESNPMQSIDSYEFPKQRGDAVRHAQILAVSHRVLRHNDNFAHALFGEAPGFRDQVGQAATAESAAKSGYSAERADVVTSF